MKTLLYRKRLIQLSLTLVSLFILFAFVIGYKNLVFSATGGYATSSTGSMSKSPSNAILLNDGRVFATYSTGGEFYDTLTGTFTVVTGTSTVKRSTATGIAKLNDGRIFISGFGTPEIFNPTTGLFTTTPLILDNRCCLTAITLQNGEVFLASGDREALGNCMLYNPITNTYRFTVQQAFGKGRKSRVNGSIMTLLDDGKVVITCGLKLPDNGIIEIYNPISDTFALPSGPPYVQRTVSSVTTLLDGTVLIVGGLDSTFTFLSTAEIYDPSTDKFSLTFGRLNTPRGKHIATLLQNGKVLISGGCNADNIALDSLELYDPATQTFTNIGVMQTPRMDHRAVRLNDGKVLIMGGIANDGTSLSSAEIYVP